MYRLEYTIEEDDGELRQESIIIDKPLASLAADDSADIGLDDAGNYRYTIEETKNGDVTIREIEQDDHPEGHAEEPHLLINGQSVHAAELRNEDTIQIGDHEFTYFYITPPVAITVRKPSAMHFYQYRIRRHPPRCPGRLSYLGNDLLASWTNATARRRHTGRRSGPGRERARHLKS